MSAIANLSDTAANAEANALAALCNGGSIRFYSGPQPINANTALAGNTLLATLTFGSTAFAAASGGVIVANAITPAAAVATGSATFARVLKSDGTTVVMDVPVATIGGGLNLSTTAIVTGATVSISSFSLTVTET